MTNDGFKAGIQGYPGSYHAIAARQYWQDAPLTLVPADSFDHLAAMLRDGSTDVAVMAIENSIAGTLLQNYRILRENGFWVSGEIYLRIKHNLLSLPGTKLSDITEVASHPMALNQCLEFLHGFPSWKLVESEDTALSALRLSQSRIHNHACIASEDAASLYGMQILARGIETNKANYTRFFIVNRQRTDIDPAADKASVYIRIPDRKGQLLKVLQVIDNHHLNMSKLQSFPVLGSFREYFFHIDIEFDHIHQYIGLRSELESLTFEYEETGIYRRADVTSIIEKQKKYRQPL